MRKKAMLHSVKKLTGFTIATADGELGTIKDIYFDDEKWAVRHLVVDADGWLTGRNVLISPHSVLNADWQNRIVNVNLTRQQIEASPGIDSAMPVSRQHETDLNQHYGYPHYWAGPMLWGYAALPGLFESGAPSAVDETTTAHHEKESLLKEALPKAALPKRASEISHLRSADKVIGYAIQATEEAIGHVNDFLVDEKDWAIGLMVVDTHNWWPGKHVLISPQRVGRVSWNDGYVFVNVTRGEIESCPEYDPAHPPTAENRRDLYRHPGRLSDLL